MSESVTIIVSSNWIGGIAKLDILVRPWGKKFFWKEYIAYMLCICYDMPSVHQHSVVQKKYMKWEV